MEPIGRKLKRPKHHFFISEFKIKIFKRNVGLILDSFERDSFDAR